MDIASEKVELGDIIGKENLGKILASVSKALNIYASVYDSFGEPLATTFCEENEKKCNICEAVRKKLLTDVQCTCEVSVSSCPLAKCSCGAAPISVDGSLMGEWVICCGDKQMDSFGKTLSFISSVTGEMLSAMAFGRTAFSPEYSAEVLDALMDIPNVHVFISDFDTGKVLLCNGAYARSLNKSPAQVIGSFCYDNEGGGFRCPTCAVNQLIDGSGNILPPLYVEDYDEITGSTQQVISRAVHWVDGRLAHMKICIDVTKMKKLGDELYELAYFDKIAEIPNTEKMELDIKEKGAYEYLVAVSLMDLRRINSIYGRDLGDHLLRRVRDYILHLNIRGASLYRGKLSEFYILFSNTGGDDAIPLDAANTIRERCEMAWKLPVGDHQQNIFTSANICVIPLGDHNNHFFGYLYSAIEHGLDIARKTDSVIIYDDELREKFHTGLRLELSLKEAVKNNMQGFYVVFQPIVDVRPALWRGLEALCRWDSPEFGHVSPDVFIPIAESTGLIGNIGMWVFEQAVMQSKAWGLDKIDGFVLEVNISPIQLTLPNLDQIITDLLKKYNFPPHKLGLEITESNELNFTRHTMETIVRLSEIGVIIVLDDFGSGYSSFSTLHKLPVKVLKTDKTFMAGMETDSHLRNLLCIMISLAHGSNMKLVAEGVETDAQAQFLLNQGTDYFQGFYFSKPLTSAQLAEKIDNFYYPTEQLLSLEYKAWSVPKMEERREEFDEYNFGTSLYRLLNVCVRELFINPNSDNAINVILSYIGKELHAHRACVALKGHGGLYSTPYEWRSHDMPPMSERLSRLHIETIFPELTTALLEDGLLAQSDTSKATKTAYSEIFQKGVTSYLILPIMVGGQLQGYLEIQYLSGIHIWTSSETYALKKIADLLSISVGNISFQTEIEAQHKMWERVMDHLRATVYVTDIDTNEILFVSATLQNLYANSQLKGRLCYEALQYRTEKCLFCPVTYLQKNPERIFRWEFYSEILKKRFRAWDCIIPWGEERKAHLEFLEEITE